MVKAIDCKSIGRPSLVRIQPTSSILGLNLKSRPRVRLARQPVFSMPRLASLATPDPHSFFFFSLVRSLVRAGPIAGRLFIYNRLLSTIFLGFQRLIAMHNYSVLVLALPGSRSLRSLSYLNFLLSKKSYLFLQQANSSKLSASLAPSLEGQVTPLAIATLPGLEHSYGIAASKSACLSKPQSNSVQYLTSLPYIHNADFTYYFYYSLIFKLIAYRNCDFLWPLGVF